METKASNPLQSYLFTKGFVNDETPLDEYNLNLILAAINFINENRIQEYTIIQSQVNNEKDNREAADKKLYGADIPEEDYLTLTGIDKSQKDADKAMNQAVFGEDHPPEDATPLQTQVEALQTQVSGKENTFDVMITDGGGVPQSVIDGINTTWNGEFEEV